MHPTPPSRPRPPWPRTPQQLNLTPPADEAPAEEPAAEATTDDTAPAAEEAPTEEPAADDTTTEE